MKFPLYTNMTTDINTYNTINRYCLSKYFEHTYYLALKCILILVIYFFLNLSDLLLMNYFFVVLLFIDLLFGDLPRSWATSGVQSEHERPQFVGAGGCGDHHVPPLGEDHDAEHTPRLAVLWREHLLSHDVYPVLPVLFHLNIW